MTDIIDFPKAEKEEQDRAIARAMLDAFYENKPDSVGHGLVAMWLVVEQLYDTLVEAYSDDPETMSDINRSMINSFAFVMRGQTITIPYFRS